MPYHLKKEKLFLLIAVMLIPALSITGCVPTETGMIAEDITVETAVVPCYVSLHPVDAATIWKISEGNPDIPIAVLDTGIDINHPLLQGRVVEEINFSDSDSAADRHGHGTHIAAIIAAIDLRNPIFNVKVVEDGGYCQAKNVAQGIQWAADNGAKIINLSLAFINHDPLLEYAVDYAWKKGCVIVAAAGNIPGTAPIYPAFYSGCVAVTAADDFGEILQFARTGDWVGISAPGQEISSALPAESCGLKSGTSQATAYVSAISALMAGLVQDSNENGATNDEVYRIIVKSDIDGNGPAFLDAVEFLREAKDCDTLIAELNTTIVQYPDNYDACINRGNIFLKLGNLPEALADFLKAVEINPDAATAWYYSGTVYARMQQYDNAIRYLTQAIAMDPQNVDAYVDRSTVYGFRQSPGDLELSMADSRKAIEINPDSAQAHVALAWNYLWLDNIQDAILEASRAVASNPQLSAAYNTRASILFENGEYENAIADYTKAMELEPGSANIPLNRGIAYAQREMFNEALADFSRSLEIRPNFDLTLLSRAEIYALTGDIEQSAADLNTIIATSTKPDIVQKAENMLIEITKA